MTYPSTYEGFGNAFLEAVWFRKPILVNRYSIFQTDIEPIGFDVVMMDSYVTPQTVAEVESVLEAGERAAAMGVHNFDLARRFFSFELLELRLRQALMNFGQV